MSTGYTIQKKTAAYTALYNDLVDADPSAGAFTVTLPAASAGVAANDVVIVKNISTGVNPVTVAAAGTDTIDGVASKKLAAGDYLYLVSDGTSRWLVVSRTKTKVFDVRDYGAVGDGVHDDGPNFQLAFNAADKAGGGVVYAPTGTYKIATGIYLDCSTNKSCVIILRGDGAGATVIKPVLGTTGTAFQVNNSDLGFFVEDLAVLGDTSASNAVDCDYCFVGGFSFGPLRIARVEFAYVLAQHAIVRAYQMEIHMADTKFGGCGGSFVGSQDYGCVSVDSAVGTFFENVFFVDGTSSFGNPSPAKTTGYPWISIKDQTSSTPEQASNVFRLCSFDEGGNGVRVNPATAQRHGNFLFEDCSFNQCSNDGYNDRSIYIKQATNVVIRDTFCGYTIYRTIGVELVDAGHVVLERLATDTIGRNLDGDSCNTIKIDNLTTSARLIDCRYTLLDSACPTFVTADGINYRQRPGDSTFTVANVLAKASATAGAVAPLAVADAASLAIGVAVEAVAKATGYIVWAAPSAILDGTTWAITDQNGVTKNFWFKKPTAAPGGYITIDISAASTADQVKAAVLAVWPSFAINIADHGTGTARTDFTAVTYGESGNVPLNAVVPYQAGFTYSGMKGGVSRVLVVEQSGQQVPIKSDGATTLSPGDALTSSAASAGRVKKTTTAGTKMTGRSMSTVAATADALVNMIWHKETL